MFSFVGDTVLDPFVGTATTTLAAMKAARNSIGVELDPDYLSLAERRVRAVLGEEGLFETPAERLDHPGQRRGPPRPASV